MNSRSFINFCTRLRQMSSCCIVGREGMHATVVGFLLLLASGLSDRKRNLNDVSFSYLSILSRPTARRRSVSFAQHCSLVCGPSK